MAPFTHRLRVYWEDTDAGGVVYHANYLKFFERARSEWLCSLGFAQQGMAEQLGAIFIVTRASLDFCAPARLDDQIDVSVRLKHMGGASITLTQRAVRAEGAAGSGCAEAILLAEGEVRVACVDAATFTPRRLPGAIADRLAAEGLAA